MPRRPVALVNGVAFAVPDGCMRLIDWLRDEVGLTGPKEACGVGHCGACTVLVNGRPTLACCALAGLVAGSQVSTAEGLIGIPLGRRLASAFTEHGSFQCGFCAPGMLAAAFALLTKDASPSEGCVRRALSGNLCRCSGYSQIVEAIMATVQPTADGERVAPYEASMTAATLCNRSSGPETTNASRSGAR